MSWVELEPDSLASAQSKTVKAWNCSATGIGKNT
jgi:hypothetical protein